MDVRRVMMFTDPLDMIDKLDSKELRVMTKEEFEKLNLWYQELIENKKEVETK
jgi:hypothetical protein